MFVLTKEEKRVICFVMLAILVGLAVKEYRRNHPVSSTAQPGLKQSLTKQPEAKPRQNRTPAPSASAPQKPVRSTFAHVLLSHGGETDTPEPGQGSRSQLQERIQAKSMPWVGP